MLYENIIFKPNIVFLLGCTPDMKTKAEKWLRDNYTADWSPKPGNLLCFMACLKWYNF